jgi:hypothetical protein
MTVTETLVAGRYRVIRALGAGGMGRVWLARDELLCRDVAIKEIVLPFGLPEAEREELRLRTLREARAAARLSHPNVVQIYDVQSGDEQPWIVMEYVRSRSLLQVIEENGPLPVEQVAGIGLAVLSALDAANRVGVLHRDVKPSNVLIADDGRVVLTDFGSAMIDEGEGALTRTGVILGSPQYIAPERVDNGVSTPEADLWSLGATLYAAVEGRPPYTRSTTLRSLIALTTDKPDQTRLAGPLKPVLLGLLQRNPQARLTPKEVEQRLRKLADVQTTVHLRHIPEQRRPEALEPARYEVPERDRNAAGAAAGVAAGAAVGAAAAAAATPAGAGAVDAPVAGPRTLDAQRVSSAQPYHPVRGAFNRRWRMMAVTGTAAIALPLALVGTGNAGWLPGVDGDPSRKPSAPSTVAAGAAGGTTSAPAASASPSPSPSASPAAAFVRPADYRWWVDRNDFRFAHPDDYVRLADKDWQVFFCAPGGPPTIRVRVLKGTGTDPAAALAREEGAADLPGYRRISIGAVPQAADQAAVWEYTFTDQKAGPLHGIERAFVLGGRTYLLQWRTPAKRWAAEQKTYQQVVNSFELI